MPPAASPDPQRRSQRTGHKTIYTPPYELVVAQLKKARLAAGLSQEDLADRLGRTQLWVSRTERGERRADLIEWLEYILGCGADVHELIREVSKEVHLPRRR